MTIRFRSVPAISQTLQNAKSRKRGCVLLIGAGCSVKAGIPRCFEMSSARVAPFITARSTHAPRNAAGAFSDPMRSCRASNVVGPLIWRRLRSCRGESDDLAHGRASSRSDRTPLGDEAD